MDRLLARDAVTGHPLVYGELLIGDRGGRNKLLADYERMHQADMVPHGDVVGFVRDRRLHGKGAGWIDIRLTASAAIERLLSGQPTSISPSPLEARRQSALSIPICERR